MRSEKEDTTALCWFYHSKNYNVRKLFFLLTTEFTAIRDGQEMEKHTLFYQTGIKKIMRKLVLMHTHTYGPALF